MKTMLFAAAVLTLAGAASASALGPFANNLRAPPILVEAPTDRGVCALRSDPYSVSAYAAPMNAVRWSLNVRAPGFTADQGGPLVGQARLPSRVSRITLVRDTYRGASGSGSGPVHAELTLYDHDGRIVCVDRLTPRAAFASRW
jgi:hypothetical protein